MPTPTIEYQGDAERSALEQAIAYVAQLRQIALTASFFDAQRMITQHLQAGN